MRVEFRPTSHLHFLSLAARIRPADAAEVLALGLFPYKALLGSWRQSNFATTLLLDGKVAACAGLIVQADSALGLRRGQVWLLTSTVVDAAPMAFHRAMKELLGAAAAHAETLWQYVDARYTSSLRWLERLGFVVHPPRPYGPLRLPFHLVVREF